MLELLRIDPDTDKLVSGVGVAFNSIYLLGGPSRINTKYQVYTRYVRYTLRCAVNAPQLFL